MKSLPVTVVVSSSKEDRRNCLRTFTMHVPLTHPCHEFWGRIEEVAELQRPVRKKREVHRFEQSNSINVMRLVFQ